MCRHIGYVGRPVTLHSLVYEPEHSLEHQSYAPELNLFNKLNADGFGVGWYHQGRAVRYRRTQPIWTDASFADVARAVSAGCVVAAVRSATAGFPVDESCSQPLRYGRWLFSHNGLITDFAGVEAKVRDAAGDLAAVPEARAPFDSAPLFAMAVGAWRSGASLAEGLSRTVAAITAIAGGRFNLLASDGTTLAATTWGDSLFVRSGPGFQVIASEPYDKDPSWRRVPDRSLVTATGEGAVRIDPL
jgi:glutamine amidotransferase